MLIFPEKYINIMDRMIKRFFELQEKVLTYDSEANTEILKKAYTVAADAHFSQTRATNEPFIIHPLAVAGTLADLKLDVTSIAAGLLHDVVEDTDYTTEKITRLFGEEIGRIVGAVTKISKISEFDALDAKAETLKKMIIAMTNDVRVILIKLADRLHNIRTLKALKHEKRIRIAKETLDIYAPIAYRLGMGKIKTELENISFQFAFPEDYEKIHEKLTTEKKCSVNLLENLKNEINEILKSYKIPGEIHYRKKREISVYRKLKKRNISLDNVFDLLGLRVITNSIENCYAIMGEIHQKWRFIPSRWKDFIATHKSNGYQSIHTTIITNDGIFEIQIRTNEMHKIAEEGIAAHWKYKEGISSIENDPRLDWFREMIELHKENPNPEDFLSMVKMDLTPNEIYVFTPKGKVVNLKVEATPIDFAYAIHTEIGNHCKGAIVNEQLVPLRTKLNSGELIEILTAKTTTPSVDWLKFVVTNKAKKNIMSFVQKKENLLNIEKGRKLWKKIIRDYKKDYNITLKDTEILKRISKLHYSDIESFYRDIGSNKKSLDKKTLKIIFPEISIAEIKPIKKVTRRTSPIYRLINVEGYKDIDVTLAKCCNPIKGENIVGYITLNRGLVIHREDCVNLKNALDSRRKRVAWNDIDDYLYQVRIELMVEDKPGLLCSISSITAKYDSNIKKIENEKISQNLSKIKIIFDVRDSSQLAKIRNEFKNTKGVYSIFRKRLSEK
jgi:guanosine-3',5'-bis(diphosphate) 3'-pyrophosphohydrolase